MFNEKNNKCNQDPVLCNNLSKPQPVYYRPAFRLKLFELHTYWWFKRLLIPISHFPFDVFGGFSHPVYAG